MLRNREERRGNEVEDIVGIARDAVEKSAARTIVALRCLQTNAR